ncbi:gamma-glutamylcyclotransferase family protein [Glycomyces sp. NPDC047010]|uniref:gamma-glutamylcyclotransferase family protein n=1 Tax=Glycomyces sp. NPDC047010 TaxID=3155023 RepID=UPI0033FA3E38
MTDHLVFSYGTLQLPAVQVARFGRELAGTPDALPGYRLDTVEITDPAVIADSGATHHPIAVRTGDPADRIDGTALALTDTDLTAADDYEVDDYTRVQTTLVSGRTAWIYVEA